MKRRDFIGVIGGAVVAWPLAGRAQQPEKIRRIGLLSNFSNAGSGKYLISCFVDGLSGMEKFTLGRTSSKSWLGEWALR